VEALRRVRARFPSTPDASVAVTVPAVHLFDSANHAIVMDDAGPVALPLKAALLAGRISPRRGAALGTALGEFLRALHARGRDDVALREGFARNEAACEISAFATYGRLGAMLRALDEDEDAGQGGPRGDRALLRSVLGEEPLGVSEDTMRVIEALAERRGAQIKKPPADTFVMGDFWPGNVLVNVGEEEEDGQNSQTSAAALVVDWELAKAGLAGLDVGQFCAELATLRCLRPDSGWQRRAEAAGVTLASFVRAYFAGDVSPEADETRRVAVGHFGVHLAVWTPRTGWDGGAGPTRALMLDGVARLVEGADADRVWTDEELVQTFLR
jgi:5-methylthioribose kinase